MPDITSELYSIKTDAFGGDVLGAIYDALLKIDNFIGPVDLSSDEVQHVAELLGILDHAAFSVELESYNITDELNTIKNGRYGSEIRTAIHDALDKLEKAAERQKPPAPEATGGILTAMPLVTVADGGTVVITEEE